MTCQIANSHTRLSTKRRRVPLCSFNVVALFWFILVPSTTSAQGVGDLIELKNGGQITGRVLDENAKSENPDSKSKTYVVIETDSGGKLQLERNGNVRSVRKGSVWLAEYNQFVANLGDTPDDHWKAVEWCGKPPNNKAKFAEQIEFHLRRIVALDANDAAAFKRLGYEQINNRWVNEEQFYAARGYVRNQGKWRPLTAIKIHAASDLVDQAMGSVNESFQRWYRNTSKLSPAEIGALRDQRVNELKGLMKPQAIGLVFQKFDDETDPNVRDILLEVIGSVGNGQSKLCAIAVYHSDAAVRDRAITLLEQPQLFRPMSVVDMLSNPVYLRHKENLVVRRAAYAIGEIGTHNGVLPLIGSIKTPHVIANPNAKPDQALSGTFDNSGGAGLSLGDDGPKTRTEWIENPEVLGALKRITKTDKGRDATEWMKWYVETYTLGNQSVRADD